MSEVNLGATGSAATAKDRLLNLKANSTPAALMELDKGLQQISEPEVANSVEATLAQRGSRYGDFTDHAALCQSLKNTAQTFIPSNYTTSSPWEELTPVQKQALEVIFDKIARILTGDPNYDDNWHDIQGYAKLVEDRLPCNAKKGEC